MPACISSEYARLQDGKNVRLMMCVCVSNVINHSCIIWVILDCVKWIKKSLLIRL